MSKRKASEAVADKAAGKRRADTAPGMDDDDLLEGLLNEDSGALGEEGILDNADQLVEDLADGEEDALGDGEGALGGLEGDDDGAPAASADDDAAFFEVGELPDGLTEEALQQGEEVDLSGYELTVPQARRVAQALAQNEGLSTVRLADHSLPVGDLREEGELEWDSEEYTDVDAIIIAELLKTNTEVVRLDLARNQIGDAGACALAAMLGENGTVEYLNLESNQFGERAGNAFCEALSANRSVQYLNLMYNSVPPNVQDALRKMWQDSERGQGVGLHL